MTNGFAPKDILPTPKARDSQPEGYEAGLRRVSPQVGTVMRALAEGDERFLIPTEQTDMTLLRSPKASEGQGGALGEAEALRRGNTVGVRDQVLDLVAGQGIKVSRKIVNDLLPTPNTMEHREIKTPEQIAELKERSPGGYRNLRESVINDLIQSDTVEDTELVSGEVLLPTTRVSMAKGPTSKEIAEGNPKSRIETEVMLGETSWGKFEPAIRRWEAVLGRPAPAPTLPDGKDGSHRLSPWLTEWMMGLPEGWICSPEIGLSRNDQLKAAGNGVVPQQAELALRILLEGVEFDSPKDPGKLLATPNTMDTLPPRYGEAYERVRNAGGRKNRDSSGNLREQVVHNLPQPGGGLVNLPTPTVSDTFTGNLKSSQQKEGSLHSVTLPQAVERLVNGNG